MSCQSSPSIVLRSSTTPPISQPSSSSVVAVPKTTNSMSLEVKLQPIVRKLLEEQSVIKELLDCGFSEKSIQEGRTTGAERFARQLLAFFHKAYRYIPNIEQSGISSSLRLSSPQEVAASLRMVADLTTMFSVPVEVLGSLSNSFSMALQNVKKWEQSPQTMVQGKLALKGQAMVTVPLYVFSLTNLKKLSLEENVLSFLSPKITQLQSLECLKLRKNLLQDLPQEMSSMTRLERLSLASNKLYVAPSALQGCSGLRDVDLAHNSLRTLPGWVERWTSIVSLNLEWNRLESLPNEIGRLKNLQRLSLANNRLSALPKGFSMLVVLKDLQLQFNQLKKIPDPIFVLTSLTYLDLRNNLLSTVSRRIVALRNLGRLRLQDNPLASLPGGVLRNMGNFLTVEAPPHLLQSVKSVNDLSDSLQALSLEVKGIPAKKGAKELL